MGVFEKLKNVFFEEEYVEVEEPIRKPKKEKTTIAKKIDLPEMPKIKEEKTVREKELEEEVVERVEKKGLSDSSLSRSENRAKFPMTFEEDDFKIDSYPEQKESILFESVPEKKPSIDYNDDINGFGNAYNDSSYIKSKEDNKIDYTPAGLYEGGDYKKEQKIFRPTPIISPIYGILDKNYKKEEIVQKKEIRLSAASAKKVDLDSVREKAYGDLANDITSSMLEEGKKRKSKEEIHEIKEEPSIEERDSVNSLYDLNDTEHPVVSNVTVGDAEEYFNDLGLEYNVDYKEKKEEKATGRRSNKKPKEIEENKKEENEDSLFDLIDSMYQDSEDE